MAQEEFRLSADVAAIQLGASGISLIAPGLIGKGRCFSKRQAGETRALTGELSVLDRGLAEADLEDRHTLVIDAATPKIASAGSRSSVGSVAKDEILVQVPLKATETSFAMYVDEAGLVSFHYPQSGKQLAALPSRSIGHQERIRIPLRSGQLRAGPLNAAGDSRALIGKIVAKVIKIIVVQIFPNQVGNAVSKRVKAWEDKHRSFHGFHGGDWGQLFNEVPVPFNDFASLQGRKSLLFIHGTTSTTAGAFGKLAGLPGLLDRLHAAYAGRIVGFNHHTMSQTVAGNVRDFFKGLAPGEYTFDIICHSRGGLVARALTYLADSSFTNYLGEPWQRPPGVKLKINRIVFVATPNGGTDLAIPERIPDFVERLVNLVNLLPDSTATIATGALLSIAAAVAEVALPRLPGLADQAPDSDLLKALLRPADADRNFAFQANFEPTGNLVDWVKNAAIDRIFRDKSNDLVVPTDGVSVTSAFKLPVDRVVSFGPKDGVHHTCFFGQPQMAKIADFLEQP